MKLIYSELALFSLREIVNYLKLRWTDKEIKTLRKDIEKFEKTLNEKNLIFPNFENYPDTKYTIIGNKQVKIIFRILNSNCNFLALQTKS